MRGPKQFHLRILFVSTMLSLLCLVLFIDEYSPIPSISPPDNQLISERNDPDAINKNNKYPKFNKLRKPNQLLIPRPQPLKPLKTLQDNLILFQITKDEIEQNMGNKDWFLDKIIAFGTAITQLDDDSLTPSHYTTILFNGMEAIVSEFPHFNTSGIMTDPNIQRLRLIVVERVNLFVYRSEMVDAQQLIQGKKLEDHPKYGNYKVEVEFEIRSLADYIKPSVLDENTEVTIAVIGSGPFPLTSIQLLVHLPSANITNYDRSQEAVSMGTEVIKSQGLTNRISYVNMDALGLNMEDLINVDIVFLAAMVGSSPGEKKEIISHLYKIMKAGTILAARTATGLRSFICHKVTTEEFGKFKDFQQKFNPADKYITNSIIFGRK